MQVHDTLERERCTYPWFDITVCKVLAVHVAQSFKHLVDYHTNVGLGHWAGFGHVLLEVTQGEIFHGEK